MAGLTESYCRSNETSHASQFKWLDNTFNRVWSTYLLFEMYLLALSKRLLKMAVCKRKYEYIKSVMR